MLKLQKWTMSIATLLVISCMLQGVSAQVGKKPKIVPTFDPRKPEPPKTNTFPVDPAKAKAVHDFSFTSFRVVSIDQGMGTFVLESQGKREQRTWGPGSCVLRGNTMSFRLENLLISDIVVAISDQAAVGGVTSYLAVQDGNSTGSTLRAVTVRDVKAEARHVQVSSYQVGGGGERTLSFPYVGARVFLNQRETPWNEIKAGDRGVMFLAQGNTMTHLVLHRAGPASEGTTTRKTDIETVPFSFGISKGTIKSIDRTAGTILFARHGEHKGPKSSAELPCTVGNHLIVNRKGIETWGGLREGDQASFFFDARGLAAYALIHDGPNANSTLACGTVESVDAEMKMVNVNVFSAGRPRESISLNFEEIRTRKQIKGEMVDASSTDFKKGTQVLVINGTGNKLIELLLPIASFPLPSAAGGPINRVVGFNTGLDEHSLRGTVKFTDAAMTKFVLRGGNADQRTFTLHRNTFVVDGKRAGRFPDEAGPQEGDDAIIGILVGLLLPAQIVLVNPEENSRLQQGTVMACNPGESRISFSFSKIDYSLRDTQVFVNGKRATAPRDIPIGSRACCVVTLNGLGGSDALTHVFVFTDLPGTQKLPAK